MRLTTKSESLMIKHSLKTFPNECCGFMLGTENENERTVTEIIEVNNAKQGDQTRRFQITASDYLSAEKYADDNGLSLLGVYHSHPNHPSLPSEHDRKVAQPYFSYVIISVLNNEFVSLQSWRLNDDFQFNEEAVVSSLILTKN